MAAIERTLALGFADWIEFDVHRSRDGHLIVCHDADVLRTTDHRHRGGSEAMISDLDLHELRALDAGRWFDPAYTGEQLPLFSEVLELIAGRAAVMVELKAPSRYPQIAADIAAELHRVGSSIGPEALALWSSDVSVLQELHQVAPEYPKGLFVRHVRTADLSPHLHMLTGVGAWPQITAEDVATAGELGLSTAAATLNSVERMQGAQDAGVDVVLTDFPDMMLAHLAGAWQPGPVRFDHRRPPEQVWSDGRMIMEFTLHLDDRSVVQELDATGNAPWTLRRLGGQKVEMVGYRGQGQALSVLVDHVAVRPGTGPTCLALHDAQGSVLDVIEYGDIPVAQTAGGLLTHAQ